MTSCSMLPSYKVIIKHSNDDNPSLIHNYHSINDDKPIKVIKSI